MEFGSSHYSHRVRLKLVSAQPKRNLLAELSLSSARWTRIWGVPELERRSSIEWSRRMTRSLGVCYPRRGTVRLAAYLQKAERPFVEEVLCHEMAHLAARELYGDRIRPHGREWKRLMEAAVMSPERDWLCRPVCDPCPSERDGAALCSTSIVARCASSYASRADR